MASRIKGITVEIGGDTAGLDNDVDPLSNSSGNGGFSSGLFEASCMRQAQFTSLDFDVDISSEKSAGIALSVGIDKDKAEFFDKALVERLDPRKKLGSLSKKDEGEDRIYTVKINDTEDVDGSTATLAISENAVARNVEFHASVC